MCKKNIPLHLRTVSGNDTSNFEITNLIATSNVGPQKKFFKKEMQFTENGLTQNRGGIFITQKEPPRYRAAKEEEN